MVLRPGVVAAGPGRGLDVGAEPGGDVLRARKRDQRSGNSEGMSGSASPVAAARATYSATWAWRMRSLASRAAAVAAAGQTRSMAALTAAPTSTANADTPIHSSTATGAASEP
ncbi:hypothetical protein SFUMM280S_01440 [Streptomyces fumanus]